jgi:hypothetical protein
VLLHDITLLDSPCWTVHFADCDGVTVTSIRLLNNLLVPNSDGIHSTTSRNVQITNCDIRAGDDAIIVTGFGNKKGVAENITVSNCTLQSRSAGIRVGYGNNDIRNCVFENLVITDSNRGIGLFLRDPGSISNIYFSNILIQTRFHTGHWWGKGEPIHISSIPENDQTPIGRISHIHFSHISAKAETGIVVYGVKESPIEDLRFDDLRLEIVNGPLSASYGGNFDLRPAWSNATQLFRHDIPGLYAGFVEGFTIKDFKLNWGDHLADFFTHGIELENFKQVTIEGFEGRQAGRNGNAAAISATLGDGLTIRNSVAAPSTSTFLSLKQTEGLKFFTHNDLTQARFALAPTSAHFKVEAGNLPPLR